MGKPGSIPQPPGYPLLGNLFDIDMELPLKSLYDLAEKHGELYRMKFPGHTFLIANSYAMVNEFCDEKRFPKTVFALQEMRHAMHDGLFTATGAEEPNWGIAHRILVPAFGPSSLRNMFDGMYDIASQLTMKWARYGKDSPITVTDDFTKLTLDTIALCSMDFRFNSYYKDGVHPFVEAMSDFLVESGDRMRRLPVPSFFYRGKDKKFFGDINVMRQTARSILQERKTEKNLDDRKDLLSAMLSGVDSKTGQKMTEESILDNLITFLIAGHETTSGTLSFALYHLIKHPEYYRKAQEEVDRVCGKTPIRYEHLSSLKYMSAVLRETLRLTPPLPVINVAPKKDEVVGGKYVVKAGELVIVLVGWSQLDRKVFGEDVNKFKPDRMLAAEFDTLNKEFPNAWKPFGNGSRGCIGRPFAWQESLLVLAMLFQNFDFEFDDPNYTLSLKQTLTVKPANFKVKATPRDGLRAIELEHRLAGNAPTKSHLGADRASPMDTKQNTKPLRVYYGSNSSTCQSMAEQLAANAFQHGFRATVIDCLDAACEKLSTDEPNVFITASYEGQPPDNASHFVEWVEKSTGNLGLEGVHYAVFGCGHRDWAATLHRIPKLVDSCMEERGAHRIAPLGLSDVADGKELNDFEAWEDKILWPALKERYGAVEYEGPALNVAVTSPRKSTLHQNVQEGSVLATKVITPSGFPVQKQHMEIQLPAGVTYRAGDYLEVLPVNPRESVNRVMRHFRLPWDTHLTISANTRTSLPGDSSTSAVDVFGSYVELAQPATKRNILTLAEASNDHSVKDLIRSLASDELYAAEIVAKRVSVLDLLERYPDSTLPISKFLHMLPPMRLRQYSISSSPLCDPKLAALTYSVLDKPRLANEEQRHLGVATNYLSSMQQGDMLHVMVRQSPAAFHLPAQFETTPVIMVATGTGIAPFRGFIQHRAETAKAGHSLAPAVLYFGCRERGKDDLYREELDLWEAGGVVSVRRAFSHNPEFSEGCKHIQDRIWRERDQIIDLWNQDAQAYICGSRVMGESTKDTFVNIFMETAQKEGKDTCKEDMKNWFETLKNTRYAVEVFD